MVVGCPLFELHRTCAYGVLVVVVAGLCDGLLADDGAVCTAEIEEQGSKGLRCLDRNGVVVDNSYLADLVEVRGYAGGSYHTVDGELDIACLEFVAVVELDAFTEMEYDLCIALVLPAFSQAGLNIKIGCLLYERVVNVVENTGRITVVGVVGIHCRSVCRVCDDDVGADIARCRRLFGAALRRSRRGGLCLGLAASCKE